MERGLIGSVRMGVSMAFRLLQGGRPNGQGAPLARESQ